MTRQRRLAVYHSLFRVLAYGSGLGILSDQPDIHNEENHSVPVRVCGGGLLTMKIKD